jgi:hypothetical protein
MFSASADVLHAGMQLHAAVLACAAAGRGKPTSFVVDCCPVYMCSHPLVFLYTVLLRQTHNRSLSASESCNGKQMIEHVMCLLCQRLDYSGKCSTEAEAMFVVTSSSAAMLPLLYSYIAICQQGSASCSCIPCPYLSDRRELPALKQECQVLLSCKQVGIYQHLPSSLQLQRCLLKPAEKCYVS